MMNGLNKILDLCNSLIRKDKMDISQLTEIVATADKKQIKEQLKMRGYTDCVKHKVYKHIGLEVLFKGDLQETETLPNGKGERTYQGGIFTNVKGYESLEFIIININDDKNVFPVEMLIWAKEIWRIWLIIIAAIALTANTQTISLSVGVATGIKSFS